MTQVEYIAILFADCGYTTAAQRKGWLKARYRKEYPDELTPPQKTAAIAALKAEKSLGL